MAYAQKNYLQVQGINGKYRIDEIGCFLTSFCNLLERFGKPIDPPGLNAYFRDHGIYIDVDDGIRDDLGWGSVSAYNPHVVVIGSGAGAPPSSNAIIKVQYISPHTGHSTTHFSLVADAAKGLILDSYDGVIKSWNIYGGPKAWAVYADNEPVAIQPVKPVNQPQPNISGKDLHLPASVASWRVYPLNKAPVIGNECGKLAPARFGGLTYAILGNPQTNVYTIQTESFGRVNIYAGPDTEAQFIDPPAPTTPPPVPEPTHIEVKAAEPESTPTPAPEPPKPAEPAPAPTTDWHVTTPNVITYRAKHNYLVNDLSGSQPAITLSAGQTVYGYEDFTKDGVTYVRTEKSHDNNWYYGIPKSVLEPLTKPVISAASIPDETVLAVSEALKKEAQVALGTLSNREKFVNEAGKLYSLSVRAITFWRKNKKQGAK